MRTSDIKRLMAMALVTMLCVSSALAHMDPTSENFTMFSWRSVGAFNNDLPHAKVRAWLGDDTRPYTGETGQAEQGWHEMHPHPGPQTASFFDRADAYPTIAGPVIARNNGDFHRYSTIFDMIIRWPYQADLLTYTLPFTSMGQTFVAEGYGLDKVSLYGVNDIHDLVAIVREGGPDGDIIGTEAVFRPAPSGDGIQPGWIIARWLPGDIPTVEGQTYYIEIQRDSGQPFAVRTHSTGNVYADGHAYYEGIADPTSDLGLFLSFNRDDMVRSPVLYTNAENWVIGKQGVFFRAASENIRAIYVDMSFPDTPFGLTTFFRVYEIQRDGSLKVTGPEKQCNSYASPGHPHFTGTLYSAHDIKLDVGRVYYLEVLPTEWENQDDKDRYPRRNLNVRIYGEKTAGMTPVIFNQRITNISRDSIDLAWEGSRDCSIRILYGEDPYNLDKSIQVSRGSLSASIAPLSPAKTISYQFVLTTGAGGEFKTPVYQARTLDSSNRVVSDPPLQPTPEHQWLEPPSIGYMNLAVMDRMYQPPLPAVRVQNEIQLQNADFSDGLSGWQTSGIGRLVTSRKSASRGQSVGWDPPSPFDHNDDFEDDVIYQTVNVTPGKSYMLTAKLYTLQINEDQNWYARLGRGDLRARLVCDPAGGTDFDGHNSTQWFRTAGQWLEFGKVWQAESNTITIGVEFQNRHWTNVVALVDEVKLVEVAR